LLGLVAGAEVLWISSGFLKPGRAKDPSLMHKRILAGKVEDFRPGEVFPFRNGQFYLVRYENGGFLALSLKCSHVGCSVLWDASKKQFQCPCHASRFDGFGNVVNPPAPRALDMYPVSIEEGQVWVNTAKPVQRKSFDPSQITFT
jgi:Rieske Fe-S protein